ncbi:helicase C-terminal domain-containing protein [Lacticaseibacillus hulanensis]|uniref:helicase C-terminal domain-containing protein n=1 Tax=Lacticaseibacillus hulanensis TaxID=2493111 RepID=UPI000FD74790|nr:helicase C-terminal domain-containing protein [Lacticaseibacillus hulanensis]
MNPDTVYAVIDLETTGPDLKNGGRIIQFGCALVRRGHVIQTVSQLVNPDAPVPQSIQQLTGITPDMLVSAPYFDEVAGALAGLLSDSVIVAHNVNFDYPFFNAELRRVGVPPLTNKAIDTVQLAQILLPNQPSYRLADLTKVLEIKHDNPHQADSDAISTAGLLQKLTKKFTKLPGPTQRLIAARSDFLVRETGEYIRFLAQRAPAITKNYVQVQDLVVANPTAPIPRAPQPDFPATDKAKRHALKAAKLRFRFGQAKMMDKIYANAKTDQLPLLIEAGTGLGKSLGYLTPLAAIATPKKKVIVATSTTVLQQQLASNTFTELGKVYGSKFDAVVLKSARHFIDLNKFATTLHMTGDFNRADQLLQLRICVWLTQTQTGDIDDLHLTGDQSMLMRRIRHTGDFGSNQSNPFFKFDFYRRLLERADQATFIITNHAFLARHYEDSSFADQPYLVVDEAHRFADNVAPGLGVHFNLTQLRRLFNSLTTIITHPETNNLSSIYQHDALVSYQLTQMEQSANRALKTVEGIQTQLFHHYFSHRQRPHNGSINQVLTEGEVQEFFNRFGDSAQELERNIRLILQVATKLRTDYLRTRSRFVASDAQVFQRLDEISSALEQQLIAVHDVAEATPRLQTTELTVPLVQLKHPDDLTSLTLRWRAVDTGVRIQELLSHFTAPVFTGATLTVRRRTNFLAHELGYNSFKPEQVLITRSPFKFRDQARILLASDAPEAPTTITPEYIKYLVDSISALVDNEHQTLVLFTSLNTIKAVYNELCSRPVAGNKEILAQGVTGSAAKIARRFAVSTNAVLLGAASFFEGVDYPSKQLESVIVTRLPFANPSDPVVKARAEVLKANGLDPFKVDALPRATLQLRQAFGRLIRREDDRGVFIILDPRFTKTQFGRGMQKSLPHVDTDLMTTAEIPAAIEQWLKPLATDLQETERK